MAKRFRARKAKEVRAYLVAHGYAFMKTNGDDDIYARHDSPYTVKIPTRDNEEIQEGTMNGIVKYIRISSGVNKNDILEWWKENGFGE